MRLWEIAFSLRPKLGYKWYGRPTLATAALLVFLISGCYLSHNRLLLDFIGFT